MSNEQLDYIFGPGPGDTQPQAPHEATDELVKGSAGIVTKESNPPVMLGGQPVVTGTHVLRARHKIGDTVTITAKVAGIQFSDSKVRYAFDLGRDLAVVDSEHVSPAFNVGKD